MTTPTSHPVHKSLAFPRHDHQNAWTEPPTDELNTACDVHTPGLIPAHLVVDIDNPGVAGITYLSGDRDADLHWKISDLTQTLTTVRRGGLNPFTAAALGRPLINAHLTQLAIALGITTIPDGLDDRSLWDRLSGPLTTFFSGDEVDAGERDVMSALELFAFVENYGTAQGPRAGQALAHWFLDFAELGNIIERARESLNGFTTAVDVISEFRAEMEEDLRTQLGDCDW